MIQTGSRPPLQIIAKWAITGAFITIAVAWLLLKSSFLAPVLSISTIHFPAVQSQLFYKHNDEYKERHSEISKIDVQDQTFRFTLLRYDGNVRWDPLEKAGSFYVKSVNVSIFGYSRAVALDKLTPQTQIDVTDRDANLLRFTAPAGASDPQINIALNARALDKTRYTIALLLGLLGALTILGWLKWHAQILSYLQGDQAGIRQLKSLFKRENFSWNEFLKLFGAAIILNIIPLVNFFLSVDDERGAFRTDPSVWIADGRWTAFLVEKFVFPQPVMPFVPQLFFYASLALAYMFMLRAHRLTLNWTTALAYCVLVAHPLWWFIGEFYSNIPSTGLGVLVLSIGIFAFSKCTTDKQHTGKIVRLSLFSSFVLALAIGAYQSLVMFYLVAGLGVILFDFRKDNLTSVLSIKPTLQRLSLLFATLVGGVVMYVVLNKLFQLAYPSSRTYIDNFLRIDDLIANPILIIKLVVMEAAKLYSGSAISYGVSFGSAGIVLGLSIVFLMTQKTWKATFWGTTLIGSMLIAPFLLNFVAGGIYLPLRSMLAVSFVAWITTVVILEKQGLLRVIGAALSIVLLFQMLSVNGQYSASTIMATTHDRLTAEALYERISRANPDFDKNDQAIVDIYGRMPFSSRYPAPETSTMSSSFFDWDQGNAYRMAEYMRLIGFSNVYALGNAARIPLTPRFDKMPVWPAEGSVRFENGVYLIKLSTNPDPAHALYERVEPHE